jgi:hypothetical protein
MENKLIPATMYKNPGSRIGEPRIGGMAKLMRKLKSQHTVITIATEKPTKKKKRRA